MTGTTPASILLITDERLSNEKAAILIRCLSRVRQNFTIETIQGHEITEEQLVQKLKQAKVQLILLPLHRYQTWNRIDGLLGTRRTSGPTVAGYFCEAVPFFALTDPTNQQRKIIFDFLNLTAEEILILVRSLLQESERSGIKPLLPPNTPIYCENWYGCQGQGNRTDYVLNIPEIIKSDWIKRSSSIRIILSALWGLVYEEGPGKVGYGQTSGSTITKAYLQLAASKQCLIFKLFYYTIPHQTPRDAIKQFWPDKTKPARPGQLLLKYADFLRVHTIHETSDIEIVVGLFPSAPAEVAPDQIHTLWIEPLSARLVSEPPYEAPGPHAPHLRALPVVSLESPKPRIVDKLKSGPDPANDRIVHEATSKIRELKAVIREREATIQELRSGGVGSSPPLPPPDAEGLLEAFQLKYFEARFQIRQFEIQIHEIQKKGANSEQVKELRLKMEALANREKAWIKEIMKTLENYHQSNQKPQKK